MKTKSSRHSGLHVAGAIEGQTVTVRSDIYSLGLVLYELFTGKRAFEAPTLGELMNLRRSDTTPTTPSEIVKDIDPAIERVIDRCMQKVRRTSRVCAASRRRAAWWRSDCGGVGGRRNAFARDGGGGAEGRRVASGGCGCVVGFVFSRTGLRDYLRQQRSAVRLRSAQQITGCAAGTCARSHTRCRGNGAGDRSYLLVRGIDASVARPAPRRYSPRAFAGVERRPTRGNPVSLSSESCISRRLRLFWRYVDESTANHFGNGWSSADTNGRLLEFYTVPPQVDPVSSSSPKPQPSGSPSSETETRNSKPETQVDWSPLFRAAGFNLASFKTTASQWAPLYTHDERVAWEGVFPEQPDIPIRVEAAAYRGKPVHFEVVAPWDGPERQQPSGLPTRIKALFTILLSVFVLMLVGSSLLAIRNLRQGRGDRKGAWRLGVFVFIVTLVMRMFSAHHVPTFDEFGTILNALQDSLFAAAFLWLVYIALEPFVRRRWPHRIVSWTRLLNGDFRDPLVGRDVLVGALLGIGVSVWQIGFYFLRGWIGDPGLAPIAEPASVQLGMGYFVPALSGQLLRRYLARFNCCFSSCCCRFCCAAIGSDSWLVGSSLQPRFRFCGARRCQLDQRICFGRHFGFCAFPVRVGSYGFRSSRHPRLRSVSRHAAPDRLVRRRICNRFAAGVSSGGLCLLRLARGPASVWRKVV